MNQALDLLWRKGVTLCLLVALIVSLASIPVARAEESLEAAAETESVEQSDSGGEEDETETTDEDSSVEEESGEPEEDITEPIDEATSPAQDSNDNTEEGISDEDEGEVIVTETTEEETPPTLEEESQDTSSTPVDIENADIESSSNATSSPELVEEIPNFETITEGSGGGGTESESVDTLATTTPDTSEAVVITPAASPVIQLTSSSTEVAATTTTTIGTTTTPSASSSTTTIESGTSVALANIINIVNSNFINSDGVVFFSNFLDVVTEALDLRALYNSLTNFGCSLTSCDDETTVNVTNNAFIENYLLLQALTGGNLISGADTGVINTGDAYAGLNLINVANMNFIDSNYLLVTLNAFNDVNGDIIFPSTDLLLSSLAYSPQGADISLNNTANVNNNLTIEADSGDNTLETINGGSITTGATGATSNVFNQINSSLIGGQNITIMFRIHGDWVGEVFGAPDDLLWTQSPDGSILLFDSNSGNGGSYSAGSLDIDATNNAAINNNISITALTGENQITGAETGLISTGNAYAGANIVNLANGNVIGRNWVLAIVNIFGDFKGNIAFGRPDLWIGEMVDAPAKIQNGSLLTYKVTVINNGDSPATNVIIEDEYEADHITIKSASLPYTTSANGALRFDVGRIPKGGAVEISYQAEVVGTTDGQELTNVVKVTGRETDNNLTDNTDTATIKTYSSGGGKKSREIIRNVKEVPLLSGLMESEGDALLVKRMFKTFPLTPEFPSMRQVVVLNNPTSNISPGVVFEDILKDPEGNVVQSEVWELGEVLPGEEIELGYTLSFKPSAPPGIYTLHSRIATGSGGEDIHQNGTIIFTSSMLPEDLPAWLEDIKFTAPQLTPVLPLLTSPGTELTLETWIRSVLLGSEDIILPSLTGHSMSTATRQHDTEGGVTMWLGQLYAYLSALVSKVAPNIAFAWGGGKEL